MATLEMNVGQVNSDFQAIKDKIVEHGVEVADGTKTAEYASKVDDVFDAGKKAEYDAFWDAFQYEGSNPTRSDYAFAGFGWNDSNFKPKYDICMTGYCVSAFAACKITDLKGILEGLGKKLDTSRVTNATQMFYDSKTLTRLPEIDLSNTTSCTYVCSSCSSLVSVDKVVLKADGSANLTGFFSYCVSLESIIFEGVIGKNGLNLSGSTKLSYDSIVSIINALSTTTSGLAVTLSKTAVNNAFETSDGAGDGSTSTEWTTLIGTKTNWTISLV